MSYRLNWVYQHEGEAPDAADLRAVLLDVEGDEVEVDFAAFVELGDGFFSVTCAAVPNLQVGVLRIYHVDSPGVTLGVQPVNLTDDPCCGTDCPVGAGRLAVEFCVKSAVTAAPIEGVTVEVYSDDDRLERVAAGVTDPEGLVTLMLDPGTYYVWRYKAGLTFSDPQVRTVA